MNAPSLRSTASTIRCAASSTAPSIASSTAARRPLPNLKAGTYDVAVLKCLYLICYVSDDLPGNADNIMILMADHIDTDKLLMRKKINESLDRLLKQHYINRTGDIFKFLTDEEQDIQRSIDTTDVDPSKITEKIGEIIYGEVYPVNKFSYDIYNFPFVRMVDDVTLGSAQGGMTVQFLTLPPTRSTMSCA